jgi:hypothetical protein
VENLVIPDRFQYGVHKERDLYYILVHDPQQIFIHDEIRKNNFNGAVTMLKQGVEVNQKRYSLSPVNSNNVSWMDESLEGNKDARAAMIARSASLPAGSFQSTVKGGKVQRSSSP